MKQALLLFFFLLAALPMARAQQDSIIMSKDIGVGAMRNIKLWPLVEVLHAKDKKEVNLLFSLYGSSKTLPSGNKHFHILPFCWYDSSRSFRDIHLLSFYYPSLIHLTRDQNTETRSFKFFEVAPHISLLEFTKSKDGLLVDNNALFFLWQKVDSSQHRSSLVVFPVYWQYKSPLKKTATFFPIYRQSTYNGGLSRYYAITPLFWHFETILSVDDVMYPKGNKRTSNTLFPIYWSHRDEDSNKHILFPLIWQQSNRQYHSFTLAPLLSVGQAADSSRSHLMLTPLFWHIQKKENYTNILFPIWWNNKQTLQNSASYRHYVFPSFWSYSDRNRNRKVLFPLWFSYKDARNHDRTLLPLFSIGGSNDERRNHLMLSMLFWHFKDESEQSNMLLPLWWNKRSYRASDTISRTYIFPTVWAYRDKKASRTTVFPLFWHHRDSLSSGTSLLPLFSSRTNALHTKSHLMLTPLFWHFKDRGDYSNVLFPLVWNIKRGWKADTSHVNVVFPLLWDFRTKNKHSFTFLPLVSYGKSYNSRHSHLMLTPLFWHTENQDLSKTVFFPMVWHSTKGTDSLQERKTKVLPIYYFYQKAEIKRRVVFPLLWSFRDSVHRSFTLLPLVSRVWMKDQPDNLLAVTPLFWHVRKGDKLKNVFLPLYYDIRKGTGESASHQRLILPVYSHFKDRNRDNTVLFPLVWSLSNPRYRSFSFLPFVSLGHSPGQEVKHLTITPFFWHTLNHSDTSNVLFPLWWDLKRGRGKSAWTAKTFFPLWWDYRDSSTRNKVLFPLVWSLKDDYYRSFTLFPLFSKGQNADSSFKHIAVTPLYWQFNYDEHVRRLLFPIYSYHKKGTGPTARVWNSLLPLYFAYRDSTRSNQVVFPIVWSFKSPHYRFFSLMPLFTYSKNEWNQKKHFSITPFFWHSKLSETESRNILFPFIWNKQERYDSYRHYRNVLFPLVWSRIETGYLNRNNLVVFPIFWYYHQNQSSRLSIFPLLWFKKDPTSSRFALLPVFDYKKTDSTHSRLMVTPLYWHIKKPEYTQNIIVPFWWGKSYKVEQTNKRSMVFPIYFAVRDSNRNNKVIIPLYWAFKNKRYASMTIPPLVSAGSSPDHSREHLMLTPAFWHWKNKEGSNNVLFPLWWNTQRGEGKDRRITNVLFPIYVSQQDSLKHNRALLPLVYSLKNPFYRSFTVLPLFSSGHTPDGQMHHFVLTPLFWDVRYPESHVNLLFPFYSYYRDTTKLTKFNVLQFVYRFKKKVNRIETSILWPLIERQRDADYSYFRLSPLVWYNRDKEAEYLYIPFLYHHRIDQEAESRQALLWFYAYKREYGVKKSSALFWFLSKKDRYENGDYETRFAHYLYVNKSIKGSTDKALFPFFHTTSDPNGNRFHSGFLGFNSSFKKQLSGSKEFYQEQKTFWLIRTKSNFKNLKEKGIVKDRRELRQLL